MARYNRVELEKLVRAGRLNDQQLPTENWEFNGLGGYTFQYYTKTGLIERIDKAGQSYVFGHKDTSKHKTGYLCVEMILPYDENEHQFVSDENLMFDDNGNLLGVQYTCYIHQIASIVADCLGINGHTRGSIANHKDNCPLHNWISNIETVTCRLNNWHAAVVTSIEVNRCLFKKAVDSNNSTDFFYTNEISAYDIEKYMTIDQAFADEVLTCAASLRDKNAENVYISTSGLWGFHNYLYLNNKI